MRNATRWQWLRLMPFFTVTLMAIAGCHTTDELDIWPLVYYQQDAKKQETKLDILGPLYSYRDTPQETTHAFRPFFVGEFPKDREFTQMLFLWPLGLFRQEPEQTRIWVMPFYYYNDKQRPELGERDFDWFFLPFAALGGVDTKEGAYLSLLGWGNVKGLLGYDEIEFRPFPFYVTARDGEYKTKAYLWPLLRFGEGGGKHFSFYCGFYSYYEKEGRFRRRSYLWPIIHDNEEDLHRRHPRKEFAVLPFYAHSISDVAVSRSYLWPLFSYGYNTESGYREYNLPWPFFKYRKDKEIDELRLWPFYWTFTRDMGKIGRQEDLVLMWPIYWHLVDEYLSYRKESRYVLPFYWSHTKTGKYKGAKSSERIKVWPFLLYEKGEDETVRYRGLSPLWFEDAFPYGLEKAWLPLVTVFDYSTGPKGSETLSLLGPLYQYKATDDSIYHRLLIFSYKKMQREAENLTKFSILGGLFEYRTENGETGLRFLYLPPFIKWGTKTK